MLRIDGTPVVPPGLPHRCVFESGYQNTYPHPTVVVILQDALGQIALIERAEEEIEGGKFALPGGYLELGQTLREAARAETIEETGHTIATGTQRLFAIMDGPPDRPGRQNERNHNVVTIYTAQVGERVGAPDHEVTQLVWVPGDDLPPRDRFAFGHHDILGMFLRHQVAPFPALPIVPSEMDPSELFLPGWRSEQP